MAKKLKTYEVLVKALDNFSSINLDINVFNKKGENVFKKIKESAASGWPVPYLSFIEENSEPFTLKTHNSTKNWDGVLEYSTDAKRWSEWNGTQQIDSSSDGKLYIRGKGNTTITGNTSRSWEFSSEKFIKCLGNIENLLDYEMVKTGSHPIMASYCYSGMFYNCTSLTTAPELPATALADSCYYSMFYGCTSLTTAPELPATTLATWCYSNMFKNCTSLTTAPKQLPATALAACCYGNMFDNCTSLTIAPELPATALANNCYSSMFSNCKSLTTAPELPATTLATWCYGGMFYGCTSLATAPEQLPATALANNCYTNMFDSCDSLTGTIHCPASTANDPKRLDATAQIPANTATVVYDL